MNDNIRNQFPALQRIVNGRPIVHFDGPAGTQVPQSVIDAMVHVYSNSNANSHGQFVTAHETDDILNHCRTQVAALLGAEGPETISFGANMTTLNFSLANAIAKTLQPGDEILITQLDHEANRGPWLNQRRHGIIVREVVLEEDGNIDYADLEKKINERTRVVAIGLASNIFGTVNEIDRVRQLTYQVGALLVVDAVHYAPHLMTDVQAIDCDFLLCSAYKFYGPHIGLLYSRPGALDSLDPDRLRVQDQPAPNRIETGTQNHAALAGVSACIDFLASFGNGRTLREKIIDGMSVIQTHERGLAQKLYLGLRDLEGVDVYGPPIKEEQRAPTISFTIEGKRPEEVCRYLAEHSICAWDGHFYAKRAVEVMDLMDVGGVIRMGVAVYNTEDEVEYAIATLQKLVSS